MTDLGGGDAAPRILFVCRANVFRSPIAAALLRKQLYARGVSVDVRSAGFAADPGEAVDARSRRLRDWGIDLSDHTTRELSLSELPHEDLVLTMEHHQVAEVIAFQPDSWPRSFTLKEVVRRAEGVPPRATDEPFRTWVQRVHAGRTHLALGGRVERRRPRPRRASRVRARSDDRGTRPADRPLRRRRLAPRESPPPPLAASLTGAFEIGRRRTRDSPAT